jgi:hypothetical protein
LSGTDDTDDEDAFDRHRAYFILLNFIFSDFEVHTKALAYIFAETNKRINPSLARLSILERNQFRVADHSSGTSNSPLRYLTEIFVRNVENEGAAISGPPAVSPLLARLVYFFGL